LTGGPDAEHEDGSTWVESKSQNTVLSQIIFDNPNDDTYFQEIMSNLRCISEKKLYLHKE
jgi:hypothetical protein